MPVNREAIQRAFSYAFRKGGIVIALIAFIIFLGIKSSAFLTLGNFANIAVQVSSSLLIVIGTALVVMTGNIDVSIGSIMAFSSVVAASLMPSIGCFPASLVALVVGAVLGMGNGLAVGLLKLDSFVVTLASMVAIRALAYIYTKGYPVSTVPEGYSVLGSGHVGGLPVPTILAAGIFLLFVFIMRYTPFGRHVYATGDNEVAAIHSGINVKFVKTAVFALNGLLASVAGLILMARLMSGIPTIGEDVAFTAIAAVVMGGVSLSGGKGSLWGALIGIILLVTINNGLNLMRIPAFWQGFVKGAVIFVAILIDKMRGNSR